MHTPNVNCSFNPPKYVLFIYCFAHLKYWIKEYNRSFVRSGQYSGLYALEVKMIKLSFFANSCYFFANFTWKSKNSSLPKWIFVKNLDLCLRELSYDPSDTGHGFDLNNLFHILPVLICTLSATCYKGIHLVTSTVKLHRYSQEHILFLLMQPTPVAVHM